MIRSVVRQCGEASTVSRMGSASLREAAEAVVRGQISGAEAVSVVKAMNERVMEIAKDVKYWDIVTVVQSNAVVGGEGDVVGLVDLIRSKLSHLSPKHLIELISSLETLQCRPRGLYVDVFNRLIDLADTSMYVDEFVGLLRVLGRHNWKNKEILTALSERMNVGEMRYLHCCEVAGVLGHLGGLNERVWLGFKLKCESELEVIPIEELWKTVTGFVKLEFSDGELERLAKNRLCEVVKSISFDQVTRPIEFVQFLRYNNILTDDTLVSACKWANDSVYRPAVRTEAYRRPTIFEVALLADLCAQRGISNERLEKAITVTVKSEGGMVDRVAKRKPLKYRRRRAYLREPDGYQEMGVVVHQDQGMKLVRGEKKSNDAAFAPKLRSDVPLWKTRSNGWYFRK